MNDHELREMYQGLTNAAAAGGAGCLTPDEVMRLAAGQLPEAERLKALEHVAACRSCRADLDLAAAVAEAGTALEGRGRPAPWLILAASVVLAVGGVTLWRGLGTRDDVQRGGGDDRVMLVTPVGTVPPAAAERLVWRGIPDATFDVEVVDAAGAVVFSTTTADSTTTIPANALGSGTAYHWRVSALLPNGTRLRSAAVPLTITRP